MSRYKTEAGQYKALEQKHFDKMFSFGDEMRVAMGLDQDGLEVNDFSWEVQGFSLHVRSFPQNGWIPTIIASPTGVDGNKVGYSNTKEVPPSGWYYSPAGTSTVFYPPKAIQTIILERI